jgi:hypothetical protein
MTNSSPNARPETMDDERIASGRMATKSFDESARARSTMRSSTSRRA